MNDKNMTQQEGGRLMKTSEILTPGLHQHAMNRYVNKEGREVVMHNNKTHVTTADGTEWTLASTRTIIPSSEMPKGPVVLPKSTPAPAPKPSAVKV